MTDDHQPTTTSLGLDEDFLQKVAAEYERLQEVLTIADQRVADEQAARDRIATQLRAMEQLLGDSPTEPAVPELPRANADAVIDVLAEHGGPMHFREIYAKLEESGFRVGGADPASALLTRFFDDFRLRRVARGTYELDNRCECIGGKGSPSVGDDGYVLNDGHGSKVLVDVFWLGYAWEALRGVGKPLSCAELGDVAEPGGRDRPRHFSEQHLRLVPLDLNGTFCRVGEEEARFMGYLGRDERPPHSSGQHLSAWLNDLIVSDIKERGERASFRRVGPVGFATFEATDSPPPGTDFEEEYRARREASERALRKRKEARENSSPVRPESPASAEVGTRPQTADSPPDTALKIVSASEGGSAKANDRMSDEPRTMIDAALGILADALEPAIWEVRRLDLEAYRRVQNGDNGALTADDFADERRWASRQKPDRAMLKDPLKALKLLKRSRRIRVELLGANATWVKHLDKLLKARGAWAHYDKLSWRRVDRALDSAEAILLAIDARDAAEQVVALWPQDAA